MAQGHFSAQRALEMLMCDTDSDEDHEENEVREENTGDCCAIISDDEEVSDECMDTEDIPPLPKRVKGE